MRKYIVVTIHPIKITRHDFDFGRGKRTPKTLLLIDERDALLREATRRFCIGMKDREISPRCAVAPTKQVRGDVSASRQRAQRGMRAS
jgi:hypothetical protein